MEIDSNIYNDIVNSNNIIIAAHKSPDGDAVSSCLALAQSIKLMGKKPHVILEKYGSRYDYIAGKEMIFTPPFDNLKPELFISLDCATKDRLGAAAPVFDRARLTYNIDHHISNENYADVNIVDSAASSTAELLYRIVKNFCVLNRDIAEAFYTGIISDTYSFKYGATTPETHRLAAELLEFGVDFPTIHERVLYQHTHSQVRALMKALQNSVTENGICYSMLTKEEISPGSNSDLSGIAEYMLNFDDVNVSVFVYEFENGSSKIRLRSNGFDVNYIASLYGGGGHKQAAGAESELPPREAMLSVVENIKKGLAAAAE